MDIQTKDGILLRNIPDGTPDEEIKARIEKIRGGAAQPPKGGDFDLGRTAGIGARSAVQGVLSLPALLQDVTNPSKMITRQLFQTPSAQDEVSGTLSALGLPEAKTDGEKLFAKGVEGAAGAALGGPAGLVKNLAVGGASGLASEATAQSGGGTLAQIFAGLLGGGVTAGGMAGANMLGRGIRNVVQPMYAPEKAAGRLASEVAGTSRDKVIAALEAAKSDVPNLRLNAGQASVPSGSAEFAALQKLADNFKPTPAAAFEASQENARRAAVQTIGQDKQALEAAIAKRGAEAKANYGAAYQQQISADPELARIASNPYYRDAIPEALKMAKAKGLDPKTSLTEYLQGVKLVLDDRLRKSGEGALGDSQKKLVSGVKAELVDWLGKKNAPFDKARTDFAAASKPINQMQVGQYLEDKLVGPLENGDRAGMFAGAMRDAPRTIKSSTGQTMYDDLSQVLDPKQKQVADAVLGNLKNEATYSDLASKGTNATRKMVGEFSDPIPAPSLLNRVATVTNAIIRRVEGKGSKATMNSLADLMQDPQRMAEVMKKATPAEKQTLLDAMTRAGLGTVAAQ